MGAEKPSVELAEFQRTFSLLAGRFLELAVAVWARAKSKGQTYADEGDSIMVITLATASLEAFFNEAVELAMVVQELPGESGEVARLAAMGEVARDVNMPIRDKFDLIRKAFRKPSYAKGEAPYQDFDLLLRCRNSLLHRRPDSEVIRRKDTGDITIKRPKFVESLIARGLIDLPNGPSNGRPLAAWLPYLKSPDMHRWACNAAVGMVHSILDILPAGKLREILTDLGSRFQPIG